MPRTPDDGSGPLDVDAAFAEIVAHWDEEAPVQGGRHRRSTDPQPDTTPGDEGRHAADAPRDRTTGDPVDEVDAGEGHEPRHEAPEASPQEPRLLRPAAPLPPPPREDPPPARDEPVELRGLTEDEGFTPAEPGPLPRDVLGWAAWIAVVGAPLFLLVVALGWREVPRLITVITAAVFVAGFVTLVVRLPGSRDDDDDDGAVV